MQIQLIPDDGQTLWQVLEGYLYGLRGDIARMNSFDLGSPAGEPLPEALRGRDGKTVRAAISAGRS